MSEDTRVDTGQQRLIEIPEQPPKPFRVIAPTNPVWTENKAQFIMRYLRYFVYITKHSSSSTVGDANWPQLVDSKQGAACQREILVSRLIYK